MLEYELNDNIIHITETIHSFTDTKVNHLYYDIENWMVSSYGREGDKPDRFMDDASIAYVRKYYLPKVLDSA